jgi:hypothetical protein
MLRQRSPRACAVTFAVALALLPSSSSPPTGHLLEPPSSPVHAERGGLQISWGNGIQLREVSRVSAWCGMLVPIPPLRPRR